MSRKIYLEFQLTEFNDKIFAFQVRYQDPRFNRVNYGDIRSNSEVSIALFPSTIYLKGSNSDNDFAYAELNCSKQDILNHLQKFPAHELFEDDFKTNVISLSNDLEGKFTFYQKDADSNVLVYRLWDSLDLRFFNVIHQDEQLRKIGIEFKTCSIFKQTTFNSPVITDGSLTLCGVMPELDHNRSWTSLKNFSINEINQSVLKALNSIYGSSGRDPKIQEIGKDIYQVYCEV